MDQRTREKFKEQLRVMAAGRGDGIDLDSAERWAIAELNDPVSFFRNLDRLLPEGSVLYFEGCTIRPDVAQFYETHRASNAVCVVRDTIFPAPDTFHVPMEPAVLDGVISLLEQHSREACFDHVKAYRNGTLLLAFHDAFEGSELLVSDNVPEGQVQAFCSALGVGFRRESNQNKRNPEALLQLLRVMENPQLLRMNWPWWKKALFFWKK